MAEPLVIPLSNLMIDPENPRLAQANVSQRDAARELAQDQQTKLLRLAQHIVTYGPNQSELPIVMPMDNRRYIVLEGNRRLTALKGLENPDLLAGALLPSVLAGFRKLSSQYQENPVEAINCLVVSDRDEARVWIELRHTGENEGAGIVRWDAHETGRFRARTRDLEPHLQALDFLEARGLISNDLRKKLPTSSFKRLMSTPVVREKLGIDFEDGKLVIIGRSEKVAKAILHVVNDLASRKTRTEDIYTAKDRVNYANNLPASVVAAATGKPSTLSGDKNPGKRLRSPSVRTPAKRDKLIPSDCALGISDMRTREIESELRKLSLENHTNAISVLFRVFLELSCDDYINRKQIAINENASLATKLKSCVDDLVRRKQLTIEQAKPVRRAAQKDSFFAPSVTMMNQYVHNRFIFPAPSDLRAHWNSLQSFFIATWMP